ncbi:TlpA family protein disulfide reductase [Olivibacter jilunii]|uniref:TlpA family protein disulfide reductase n=1 Tax=Olivibacter jilunii TaxID=985016 RepID=UPI003F18CE3B
MSISRASSSAQPDTIVEVPSSIHRWFDVELSKAKTKSLTNYKSTGDFFRSDSARLIGYLTKYSSSKDFTTGMVYTDNVLTNETITSLIRIQPDGKFEANFLLSYPSRILVTFRDKSFSIYLEPGQTLALAIDDFSDDESVTAENVRFFGPTSKINKELVALRGQTLNLASLKEGARTIKPERFLARQLKRWDEDILAIDEKMKGKGFDDRTKKIAKNEVILSHVIYIYNYMLERDRIAKEDSTNQICSNAISDDFYDFLTKVPLNDYTLLTTYNFSTFINKFESNAPLNLKSIMVALRQKPKKSFTEYLFGELNNEPRKEDREYLEILEKFRSEQLTKEQKVSILKDAESKRRAFEDFYQEQFINYQLKYIDNLHVYDVPESLKNWERQDEILNRKYGLDNTFVYQLVKVRDLKFIFTNLTKDDAETFLNSVQKKLNAAVLQVTSESLFKKAYLTSNNQGYKLPNDENTAVLRKITDKFLGKKILIDFWGTFCAPCVENIQSSKALREKYKDSNRFEFVYITSEEESPEDRYVAFIKSQQLTNTYRLSGDDYRRLQDLFKFNAIPRYVLVSESGTVINDDFYFPNIQKEIDKGAGN